MIPLLLVVPVGAVLGLATFRLWRASSARRTAEYDESFRLRYERLDAEEQVRKQRRLSAKLEKRAERLREEKERSERSRFIAEARKSEHEHAEKERSERSRLFAEARKSEHEHAMKVFSLTCRRCGKLASPIPGTVNRYRCDACGNQFAQGAHRR
jgi:biotin carboxyl carrier protein